MVGIFKIRPPGEAMHFEAESNWFMQFLGENHRGLFSSSSTSASTSGPFLHLLQLLGLLDAQQVRICDKIGWNFKFCTFNVIFFTFILVITQILDNFQHFITENGLKMFFSYNNYLFRDMKTNRGLSPWPWPVSPVESRSLWPPVYLSDLTFWNQDPKPFGCPTSKNLW